MVVNRVKEDCDKYLYLLSCGFVKGAHVTIHAISPLASAMLVQINGSVVCLKKSVLEKIEWIKT